MAGQSLVQELKQTQKLSPLQIQTIKLIELPVQELEQRVRKELEENPVIEEVTPKDGPQSKDVSIDEYKSDDTPSYKLYVNNYGKDEKPQYNTFSVKESFTQSLMEQLGYCDISERQKQIASFLIGSLDEKGYLTSNIPKLVDDLAFRMNLDVSDDEVYEMLKLIQTFEPSGVGARDLRECLLLQLDANSKNQAVQDAVRILTDFYTEFSNKHINKILTRLNLTEERYKAALKRISKLNPFPGGQIDDSYNDQAQQIIPDFILNYDGVDLKFDMPRFSIPELKVNRNYASILERAGAGSKDDKEAAAFIKQKLDSAKWFIEAIKQRYNTLSKTMQAILEFQHDYFVDGDESNLKPMVLRDIAEITGFDISTISRVVNSKYIETHFGVYPLKYFFSEGLADQSGKEVSTRELKKAISELIDNEDKRKPLTDDSLVVLMEQKGYKVARRTIAKYRDQLGIPTARLRKDL